MEIISLLEGSGIAVTQWLGMSAFMFLRYAIIAGIAYAFYYKFLKGKLSIFQIMEWLMQY